MLHVHRAQLVPLDSDGNPLVVYPVPLDEDPQQPLAQPISLVAVGEGRLEPYTIANKIKYEAIRSRLITSLAILA